MIHLNECLFSETHQDEFYVGSSLHVPCQMCSTQKEVDVNASQMILNSVMCLSVGCLLSG